MPDHQLILRHFELWLEKQRSVVDIGLIGTLLDLRGAYDELEPTYWPPGSVEDLLLRLWPAKGDVAPPDPDALAAALEAWFKFLRNTGRMSLHSAAVKDLVKECRRAAPDMADAASDRAGWSPTKAIMEFGRSQGIDFDDLADVAALQASLEETNRRWNDLPVFERQRLMPSPASEGLCERDRLYAAYHTDDPVVALICSVAHEMPDGPPETSIETVGAQFAASPYLRTLLDFATWAADGIPLTAIGNLRVAPALEAYDVLGLEQWTRHLVRLEYDIDPPLPGPAKMGVKAWIEREVDRERPKRSAGDSRALARLIAGGAAAGLLIDDGRSLVGRPPAHELDSEGWRDLGLRAAIGVFEWIREKDLQTAIVTQAILRSHIHGRRSVSLDEMAAFCDAWTFSPEDRTAFGSDRALANASRRGSVNEALGLVADLGILVLDPSDVRLTEAGDDFLWTWWDFLERQRR